MSSENHLSETIRLQDFPGGTAVKNPPAKAGNTGSVSVQEEPMCGGRLSPWATTTEAHSP